MIININSWPYSTTLAFASGGFILAFINIAIKLYMSHTYLSPLLDALPKSRYAQSISRTINQRSMTSKSITFSLIAGLILFKKSSIRDGDLCQDDIDKFPKGLERIIKFEFILSILTITWVILICILFNLQEKIPHK